MRTEESLLLENEQATMALGARLAGEVTTGAVFLCGDLGAGKTCLTRGWLQALGHQGAVKSPTYTLVEPYFLGEVPIYHFDLYRLQDPEELELIGAREYFDQQALCLVEWPERGADFLPEPELTVRLSVSGDQRRAQLIWGEKSGEKCAD